ncbi:MAG: PhzF family phenazine biosynthesis protein [Drouetiella hepatica Uher 2000/2452]|jgi:PhzF family phenazine biosynthesis protein|uniref:PhzF family phenazine biosynthesis protein n=1 Tax=Drouetiella hepatica Uher 2000/2452 TaxID=904376 RepID=A0A951QA22_9CYAN|nr:PhzF family phenazine biosynthesis protein [Drouetiella hepatica Uher 2000/2452]
MGLAIAITQVDAFTDAPFAGNPAAVCLLREPMSDRWMQSIAQEMNLSETAFLLKQEDGYNLRWFTPAVEIDLCGHATLASAHVLWSEGHLPPEIKARFHTRSGLLVAKQQGEWIQLDFPVNLSQQIDIPPQLTEALAGAAIDEVWQSSLGYLVALDSEKSVRELSPHFGVMANLPVHGVIVTSLADEASHFDFVSRFFAPQMGINEDPVTGSAHCCLAPFWRDRLHKSEFLAYQASARGGVIKVQYEGDRVYLGGQAVTVLRGELLA